MPVNLAPPKPESLHPVAGVRLGIASAGIKKPGRKDVTLIELAPGSSVAGMFTRNRFCAAPVQICKARLAANPSPRALLINTGNANAGTGDAGLAHARASCSAVAEILGCDASEVLPFSTGVILEPLPVDKIVAALPSAWADLAPAHWAEAAHAIMTTDIVAKATSRRITLGGREITVTGMAKGSGMIHPNMATMLGFVATDATVTPSALHALLEHAVNRSFNRISVDGDTSTNDSAILIATGAAGNARIDSPDHPDFAALRDTVTEVAAWLAQAIVRDGEGATKFMEIAVSGGRDEDECLKVAYAIARSPLVKTAFFASDPNLGRILAAVGYAGIDDLDVARVRVHLGKALVAEGGGRAASYTEDAGRAVMEQPEIAVRIDLARGHADATVWTCDFSYDYVKINAEYRT